MKFFSTFLVMFFFIVACSDTITGSFPEGSYSYISYDGQGKIVARGWFTIVFSDSPYVRGDWNFKKIGTAKDIGPQIGAGALIGEVYNSDSIWIELNPQFKDNNLQLRGSYSRDKMTGEWHWITFAGVSNTGTFVAKRY